MKILHYILNEKGEPIVEPDLFTWGQWMEDQQKIAGRIVLVEYVGISRVSTVFLGLDHGFGENRSPIVWETMVFGGPLNDEQVRCAGSREQAMARHAQMVERVQKAIVILNQEN
jgi:hypothetical protein